MSLNDALLARVSAMIPPGDDRAGIIPLAVDGLCVIRYHQTTSSTSTVYSPVLCTVLQGAKETRTPECEIDLRAGDALVVSHHLPVTTRVTRASAEYPYLAIIVSLSMPELRSLHGEIGERLVEAPDEQAAMRLGANGDEVSSALLRLLDLVDRPVELVVMAPLITRELHFRLLLSEHGGTLRSLLDVNSSASRVTRAIDLVRERYASALTVRAMARAASMSESSFHEHFKRVTGTTPLQYLKDFRLLESRRLIIAGARRISDVAAAVGYESPSQFSREYSRKFGNPPSRDARRAQ